MGQAADSFARGRELTAGRAAARRAPPHGLLPTRRACSPHSTCIQGQGREGLSVWAHLPVVAETATRHFAQVSFSRWHHAAKASTPPKSSLVQPTGLRQAAAIAPYTSVWGD